MYMYISYTLYMYISCINQPMIAWLWGIPSHIIQLTIIAVLLGFFYSSFSSKHFSILEVFAILPSCLYVCMGVHFLVLVIAWWHWLRYVYMHLCIRVCDLCRLSIILLRCLEMMPTLLTSCSSEWWNGICSRCVLWREQYKLLTGSLSHVVSEILLRTMRLRWVHVQFYRNSGNFRVKNFA